jgi:hypothetical protein
MDSDFGVPEVERPCARCSQRRNSAPGTNNPTAGPKEERDYQLQLDGWLLPAEREAMAGLPGSRSWIGAG